MVKELGQKGERGGDTRKIIIQEIKCLSYQNNFPETLLLAPLRGDQSQFRGNVYGDNHTRGLLCMLANHVSDDERLLQVRELSDDEKHILDTYGDVDSGSSQLQRVWDNKTKTWDVVVPKDYSGAVVWGKNKEILQEHAENGMQKYGKKGGELEEEPPKTVWFNGTSLKIPQNQWEQVEAKLTELRSKLPWTSVSDFGFKLVKPHGHSWTDPKSLNAVELDDNGAVTETAASYVSKLLKANYVATAVLEVSFRIHKGESTTHKDESRE